jgi:hypothetical protein
MQTFVMRTSLILCAIAILLSFVLRTVHACSKENCGSLTAHAKIETKNGRTTARGSVSAPNSLEGGYLIRLKVGSTTATHTDTYTNGIYKSKYLSKLNTFGGGARSEIEGEDNYGTDYYCCAVDS